MQFWNGDVRGKGGEVLGGNPACPVVWTPTKLACRGQSLNPGREGERRVSQPLHML
ncbi:hypothetical protein DPMN_166023 [Dreissena polymorpha]|uniref:Uncharacterized protein n=1 Tax=Dreissena polymorpha TaxID=45954 RepID=A0A9D4F1T0_DREPO|nr:hypothetical protein DPMN_166023 [Dreissena polymorpha]